MGVSRGPTQSVALSEQTRRIGILSSVVFFQRCSTSSLAACSRNSGAAHSCTSKSFVPQLKPGDIIAW
jgi:hypothetical protein